MLQRLAMFREEISDTKLLEELEQMAQIREYASREMILAAGEQSEHVCLVIEGMVRGYYPDEAGMMS